MVKGDRLKHFGFAVCFSLALSIRDIGSGENYLGTTEAGEARRRWISVLCALLPLHPK